MSYLWDGFEIEYTPTVYDHFLATIRAGSKIAKMEIFDLSGKEEHRSLRKLAFSKSNVIILIFIITDTNSFLSV